MKKIPLGVRVFLFGLAAFLSWGLLNVSAFKSVAGNIVGSLFVVLALAVLVAVVVWIWQKRITNIAKGIMTGIAALIAIGFFHFGGSLPNGISPWSVVFSVGIVAVLVGLWFFAVHGANAGSSKRGNARGSNRGSNRRGDTPNNESRPARRPSTAPANNAPTSRPARRTRRVHA
jgi:hypothetical protein